MKQSFSQSTCHSHQARSRSSYPVDYLVSKQRYTEISGYLQADIECYGANFVSVLVVSRIQKWRVHVFSNIGISRRVGWCYPKIFHKGREVGIFFDWYPHNRNTLQMDGEHCIREKYFLLRGMWGGQERFQILLMDCLPSHIHNGFVQMSEGTFQHKLWDKKTIILGVWKSLSDSFGRVFS